MATTEYQVGNLLTRCYSTRRALTLNTSMEKDLQQVTKNQLEVIQSNITLCIELLREELRLIENRNATDQGAHEGING